MFSAWTSQQDRLKKINSLDPALAIWQNVVNRSTCLIRNYRAFSATLKPRPSTIRTTHAFGCSATILSFRSLTLPMLQSPLELSTFLSLFWLNWKFV